MKAYKKENIEPKFDQNRMTYVCEISNDREKNVCTRTFYHLFRPRIAGNMFQIGRWTFRRNKCRAWNMTLIIFQSFLLSRTIHLECYSQTRLTLLKF